jgi:thermostable 8-oxoguanine DNA glycosylase
VETVRDGGEYRTLLRDEDRETLGRIVAFLGPLAELNPIGHYRAMTSEDVWLEIVGQVCVMGSARHWDRLCSDYPSWSGFKEAVSLHSLNRQEDPASYLTKTLSAFSAARFPNRSAKSLVAALNSPGVFRDGDLVLFEGLSHEDDVVQMRDTLIERCPAFYLKSASNLMIEIGLSRDVIALDSRIVGILREHFDYNATAACIQSNRKRYLSLESALREFCRAQDVSLGRLDRLLFRFSRLSAIDLVVRYPQSTRYLGQRMTHNVREQHGSGD